MTTRLMHGLGWLRARGVLAACALLVGSEAVRAQDTVLDHRSEIEREADEVLRELETLTGHHLALRVEIDDGIFSAEDLGARFRTPAEQAHWQQNVQAFASLGVEPLASTVLAQRIDDVA